jgi:osmotically-inducible protein OsmY
MRDMDAFGGYGGRGGRAESDYDRDRGYGQENRNPYYGGGGLFGGGMGGYTGGGYLGGGFGGSAIDDESEEQRAYRRQNYNDRERYDTRRSQGRGAYRDDYDDRRSGRGEGEGFFDRMADTVSSWFGGDDDDRGDYRERSYRGRGPRNYTRSDDRIRDDINDRLTYHISIDASDIEVEVNGGEVALSGHVRSRYEKRLAEDIAEDVNGVNHVENRIRVNRQDQWGNTGNYTHDTTSTNTGTSGTMSAGSGLGTGSTSTTGTAGMTGNTTSAEQTGTPTDPAAGRGRSAGGTGS